MTGSQRHEYANGFFDYIEGGSIRSARRVIEVVKRVLAIDSVLDVGCGRGAWLAQWREQGFEDIRGVDGNYVDIDGLLVPRELFHQADLSKPFDLGRKFSLVQCLEVAEHLPLASADILIDSLTAHGGIIMFSASPPGQGGEFHINEQPYDFWRGKFAARGYEPYDLIRPAIKDFREIEPWYRYNTIVYIQASLRPSLAPHLAELRITQPSIPDIASLGWRVRKAIISALPGPVAKVLVALKHRFIVAWGS